MRAATTIARSMRVARAAAAQRLTHQSRAASSFLRMPAMSPTMTEGGIAGWKKNEGETFEAGDVILEVETDKATIDVEAQDDGVMGKIIFQAGSKGVPVGEVIAVIAEEGDDLSKLEMPSESKSEAKEESKPQEKEAPKQAAKEEPKEAKQEEAAPAPKAHRKIESALPMFPSVARMLSESSLSDEEIAKIKGTGLHGMLTKGDVLVALGKISSPYGSAASLIENAPGASGKPADAAPKAAAPAAEKPLTGAELRRLIRSGLTKATAPRPPAAPPVPPTARLTDAEFDDLLSDYSSLLPSDSGRPPVKAAPQDELAGLF